RVAGRGGADAAQVVITVPGEAAVRTNIPVVRDRRASRGRYLALMTGREAPGESGWFAAYRVPAPEAGVYALTAVATAPVETAQVEAVASYMRLRVNDGPFTEIARSQPLWYESRRAWGDLSVLELGEVELRHGENTVTFRVGEAVPVDHAIAYVLRLDHVTFTLRRPRAGQPVPREVSVPVHRHGDPAPPLSVRFDGHAVRTHQVRYTVTDHHGQCVADGQATLRAGSATATVLLPRLPPGHYRVEARGVTGQFACLPRQLPVTGAASRFGVNIWVSSLVPPSRIDAFADALRRMGAGWVRDGQSWPAAEPAPRVYDTVRHDRVTRALRAHGLAVCDVVSSAPEWAMTEASLPLPADLRHAYHYARRLAHAAPEAIQLSNEPDVDTTRSTGDAHAAFVKALALGIRDAARDLSEDDIDAEPPLVVLPGIAQSGTFQDLMIDNDVVRYADVWAFHGYPDPAEKDDPRFPGAADEQHELAGRRGASGMPLWMTECGAFLEARPCHDLTPAQEVVQARYVVRSMVEGLAAGNARQFWFAGPPLHDDGVYFGLFDRRFHPLPSYTAFAVLTSLLGAARFVGAVPELPDGAVGFVFDSGRGERVTVLWAPERVRVDLRGTAYDLMGRRVTTVTASPDPVYVVVPSCAPPVDLAPRPARHLLSPAEHIVLGQRFAARNAAPGKDNGDAPPPLGYRLGRRTRMTVDVYNFDGSARHVTLTPRPAAGWSVRPRGAPRVRVPAQGRTGVDFTVTADRSVSRRTDQRLTFTAVLDDGSRVPDSVALVHLK
ncbi:hypothetical protein, partial [Streptomyces sp. MB09-02B]|uniref:hypothetical protein n=1 Tax=Streptomyces sp. MB09-02B TaxID=3028667 RepID=UPI0029AF5EF0